MPPSSSFSVFFFNSKIPFPLGLDIFSQYDPPGRKTDMEVEAKTHASLDVCDNVNTSKTKL